MSSRRPSPTGVLTDLGYVVMALLPVLHRLYRPWGRWRYSALAGSYPGRSRVDPRYLEPLRAALPHLPSSPATILEIGAGTGAATAILTERYPEARVIAVDASAAMLGRLRSDLPSPHPVLADVTALPVQTGSCELVVAHNAPFHPGEMRRAAAVDGTIVMVLGSAAGIPGLLRRRLADALGGGRDGAGAVEYRAGAGIALVCRPGRSTAAAR